MIGLVILLNFRVYNLNQENKFLLNVSRKSMNISISYLNCMGMSLDIINSNKIKVSQNYKDKTKTTLYRHQDLLNYIKNNE